ALKLKADLPAALLGLGSLYLKNGDEERAVPLLQRASQLVPKAYEPRFSLGSAYNRLGKFREAKEELEAAIRLGGEESEVYYHLARAYGGLGDNEARRKALARFAELTRKTKDEAAARTRTSALMEQAKTQLDAGNLNSATAALEEARELRPGDAQILF